jgi:acetylornithine deacetylase/succinyl-diaminopimelate desuccinylase-like protein
VIESDWSDIAAAVDNEVDSGLSDLLGAIAIPSVVAGGPEGIAASADYLKSLLSNEGWQAEIIPIGESRAVLAETGRADGRCLLLYGHHDVQVPEPLDAWQTPPFAPEIRDGRIWGRGAADNKGQFFCHIFAVRVLRRLLGEVPLRLKLLLDGEEEVGNPGLEDMVARLEPRLRGAEFVFTMDGPEHPDGTPRIVFGFRGGFTLRLTLRLMDEDQHSGHWGNLAPDAALRLSRLLSGLVAPDGRVTAPGFYDGIVPPGPAEAIEMERIPFDPVAMAAALGADALAGPQDASPLERMMYLPSLSVTGIASGYVGTGSQHRNSICAEARAQIDVRSVAGQDNETMVAGITAYLTAIEPRLKIELLARKYASSTPIDTPVAQTVIGAFERGFGKRPILLPRSGGSAPDVLFTRALGIPSLWSHIANADMRAHAPNENMRIDRIKAGSRTVAALLLDMAGLLAPAQRGVA